MIPSLLQLWLATVAHAVKRWNRGGYVGRHRLPVEPVDWRRELVEVAT